MKKYVLIVVLCLSLLGNVITLIIMISAYAFMQHVTHRSVGSSDSSARNAARVIDIITSESDGYKESHLIAEYNGQRIVLNNVSIMVPKQPKVTIGDMVQVEEKKMDLGSVKMLSYSVAR